MYQLRTNLDKRVVMAIAPSIHAEKKIRKPADDYERLLAEEAKTRGELFAIEERLLAADENHLHVLAAAIEAGEEEPPEKERPKLEAARAALERRGAAIPLAIDKSEAALAGAIVEQRESLLAAAHARLVDARERARLALDELSAAREAMTTERGLAVWLRSFPQGAGRPPGKGTPPVRALLGQNGEPLAFGNVVAALQADIDQPGAAA